MGAFYFRQRAVGDCNYGVCGDCNAIGVIHKGPKSGGEKSHFLAVTVMVV